MRMFVHVEVTVLFFSFLIDFLTRFCDSQVAQHLYCVSQHRLIVTRGELEKVKEGY